MAILKSIQFSKPEICFKAFYLAPLPEDSPGHGVSSLTQRELGAAIFYFYIDGMYNHAWLHVEFSFSVTLKCCLYFTFLYFKTARCTRTLLSVVILHVYFIWKSISDMKYLYTRNHLNNLVFAGIMAF